MKRIHLAIVLTLAAFQVGADSSTIDAAIGGGLGGATGAVIGNEVGGRDGAIVGGALGAAVGVAVTTDDDKHQATSRSYVQHEEVHYRSEPSHYDHFCPPGQAKKGRC